MTIRRGIRKFIAPGVLGQRLIECNRDGSSSLLVIIRQLRGVSA